MNTRLMFLLLFCASAISSTSVKAVSLQMVPLKASYESNLQVVVRSDVTADCIARYSKKLDSIADGFKQEGNLDGVVAVRDEKKRCETEKTVPAESVPNILPAIAKARVEYQQSTARAEIDKNRKILALADGYANSLEALKKQLTQQDKIEEATEVKQEIERLRASAEVTSAQFTLADLASKAPPPPTASVKSSIPAPAAWAPSSAHAPKPAKLHRTVACRGINGAWAKTTMSIKAGDTVTITAKGAWKCTGNSKTCGPDGYEGTEISSSYSSGYSSGYAWGRHLPSEPYGALVCKIGEEGTAMLVGKSLSFTSTEDGVLYLDSNVAPSGYARGGCSGTMAVDVEVLSNPDKKSE